ncbi:MAG: CtsR family transcriptional regulator [Clostridia bacterium]|nr:CtsR family transcriptional regulator [Clostridia bacterium]
MARLVDVIEMMIKEMLDENNGSATISRSDLAERANCVPSQITYVLSTRFSSGNGYIVESRRGGGGQITISRANLFVTKNEYIQFVLDSINGDLTQQQAKILLESMISRGAITVHDGNIIMTAVSDRALAKVDSDIRSIVRADIFRNALVGLMVDS